MDKNGKNQNSPQHPKAEQLRLGVLRGMDEYCTLKSRDNSGDIEIIRIPLAQSAILPFSYSQYRPIGLDQEGTVLPTHNLEDNENTHKGKEKLEESSKQGQKAVS